jgi:hypothetical protein
MKYDIESGLYHSYYKKPTTSMKNILKIAGILIITPIITITPLEPLFKATIITFSLYTIFRPRKTHIS